MRALYPGSILVTLFLLCGNVCAQDTKKPGGLIDDLCSCMSGIPMSGDNSAVQQDVRRCLEDAVVAHPGETLALLHRRPAQTNRAFQLGLLLGGSLEKQCPGYRVVKARLQQMPPSRLLKKQGT